MANGKYRPCETCRSFDPCRSTPDQSTLTLTDTHPDFPCLQSSAQNGCHFCALLRYALLDKYNPGAVAREEEQYDESIRNTWLAEPWDHSVTIGRPDPRYERDWAYGDGFGDELYLLNLSFWPYPPRRSTAHGSLESMGRGALWFSFFADADSPASSLIARRPPSTSSLSQLNISHIMKWLSSCALEHPQCSQRTRSALPTRLIDVGRSDGSQDPRLLIVDLSDKSVDRYAALSHCWGSPRAPTAGIYPCTTKESINKFVDGVKIDTLPRSFQDAIEVVRVLGIRYLWIDALCIIQDDRNDWAREAVRMKQVYGDAFLTIVATSAASDHDGFLHRPSVVPPPISMSFQSDDIQTDSGGNYYIIYRSAGGDEGSWLRVLDSSPWITRGWTFQEQLLSKRVLHFTTSKIFWECRTINGSEENEPARNVSHRTLWMETNGTNRGESGAIIEAKVSDKTHALKSHFDDWYRLVSQFSTRRLTYQQDIFPALSGLADVFCLNHLCSSKTKLEYAAGLWRRDLPRGLLWMTMNSSKASRPGEYLAPTWSWASVVGQVQWPSRTIERHCRNDFAAELIDCDAEVSGDGIMPCARLVLRAKIKKISAVAKTTEKGAFLRFSFDMFHHENVIGNCAFDIDGEEKVDESSSSSKTLYAIQIETQHEGDSFYPYHPTMLLLRRQEARLPSDGDDHYRRIGYGTLDEEHLAFFDDCVLENVIIL